MKKIFFKVLTMVLVFSVFTNVVNAKETIKLKECEYSDEYKAWLKLSDKEKEKAIMPLMCKNAYTTNNKLLGTVGNSSSEKYDLRDKGLINGVKNQYDTNSCWTFASNSSIESNLLVKGLGKYDLSEGHIELATSNDKYTPTRVTLNRNIDTGGNPIFTQSYVLNLYGPVNESDLTFETYYKALKDISPLTASVVESKKAVVDVNETIIMLEEQGACSTDSINAIKSYITKHGAINGSVYMEMFADGYTIENSILKSEFVNGAYYYYDGASYQSDGSTISENKIANHAITIVGWDDTIAPSNFAEGHQPTNSGAWIIQNSYGEEGEFTDGTKVSMGDSGYYYVSYEDINICGYLGGYYDVDTKVPDNAYYYDDFGFISAYEFKADTLYQGTVFTKQTSSDELLDKVTFGSYGSGYSYKIYFANNGNFTNSEEIGSGVTDHFGYTTVKLDKEIKITNDKYSIIVVFEDMLGKAFPVSEKADNELFKNLEIAEDVTFISIDGTNWSDTADSDFNTTVRAYTTNLKTNTEPEESDKKDEEIKDDAEIEVEENDNPVVEEEKNEQTGITEEVKDETVENPKTGIEDYIVIGLVGILTALGICYFLSKKNIIKKI